VRVAAHYHHVAALLSCSAGSLPLYTVDDLHRKPKTLYSHLHPFIIFQKNIEIV